MKLELTKKENNKVSFTMEIPEKDFQAAIQTVYLKSRGHFNIPGFRKGRVPRQIIELNYGKEVFYEDAVNELLPQAYEDAIDELGLEPIDMPEVDVEEILPGQDVVIKLEVEVKPEIELGDYKSIELEDIKYEVTDELVDSEIKQVQNMNARISEAEDRPVKTGDIVDIDYAGFLGEEQFEGGTAEGYELEIGSGTFIPGFEEQLVGKNKGEDVEVNVSFPEEYHSEDLAGKDVIFKVKINTIKEKELPELDDEFVKDVSEFDTVEEYKNSIREKLEEDFKNREQVEKENAVIQKLIEITEIDLPEAMIQSQLESELNEFAHRLSAQGLGLEHYLAMSGSSEEDLKEQLRPMATERLKGDLVLEALAKEENLEVTEEELTEELMKLAEIYKQDNKEEFVENMRRGDLSVIENALVNQKAVSFLMENVSFK